MKKLTLFILDHEYFSGVAGSGVALDLVQYTDVVNGKSGSRFMISQNGSTNTFKIFVRNYE